MELHLRSATPVSASRPDNQRRIFDAFVQVTGASNGERGGTGLGLAIAARLVTLMGGELKVDEYPGHGQHLLLCREVPARHA